MQHVGVPVGDDLDGGAQRVEVLVLTVEVEHQPGQVAGDGAQLGIVGDAEPRVPAGRVGEIEMRVADTGIDPQAERQVADRGAGASAAVRPS